MIERPKTFDDGSLGQMKEWISEVRAEFPDNIALIEGVLKAAIDRKEAIICRLDDSDLEPVCVGAIVENAQQYQQLINIAVDMATVIGFSDDEDTLDFVSALFGQIKDAAPKTEDASH